MNDTDAPYFFEMPLKPMFLQNQLLMRVPSKYGQCAAQTSPSCPFLRDAPECLPIQLLFTFVEQTAIPKFGLTFWLTAAPNVNVVGWGLGERLTRLVAVCKVHHNGW